MSRNVMVKVDKSSLSEIKKGIDILSEAVKVTMGPSGKNALIEVEGGYPVLTKDGVTVASSINLRDRLQNLGVQVVKDAASRTALEAGDGTTTVTVLCQEMFNQGMKMIASGYDPIKIKQGMDAASEIVKRNIKEISIKQTTESDIYNIAKVSANGEESIAKLICSAITAVGKEGVVTVQQVKNYTSSLDITEGYQVDRGYTSPYFINDKDRSMCSFSDPLILLLNKKVSDLSEITNILEFSLSRQKPLLIISDGIEGSAMQALILNSIKEVLDVCVIECPGRGRSRIDMLKDLSCVLDAKIISEGDDLSKFEEAWFGKSKKVQVFADKCIFTNYSGDASEIDQRTESILKDLEDPELSENQIAILKYRASRLSGKVAILRVGGSSDAESRERSDRVDDALSATRCAISEGIIPGGGISLFRCASKIDAEIGDLSHEEKAGYQIIKNACKAPFNQIIKNVGKTPEVIFDKIQNKKDDFFGYDARNNRFGNMIDMGIVDPTSVSVSAVSNATSAAGMLLTVGCVLVNDDPA